jgi:hypothetical protein
MMYGPFVVIAAICFVGALLPRGRYAFRITTALLGVALVAGAIAASLVK